MSIADMKKIRAAEAEAQDIRKRAEEEVVQIVAGGRKEARELIDATRKASDDAYRASIADAEKKAAEVFEQTIAGEQAACEKIMAAGRAKMDNVIDDIVGKVVGINGNS